MLSSHVGYGRACTDDEHTREKDYRRAHRSAKGHSFGRKQPQKVYKDWGEYGKEDEVRPGLVLKEKP